MTWEAFKKAFPYTFFPREMTEAKLKEFINIFKGGMSVLEFSLKSLNCESMLLFWFPTIVMK